MSTTREEQCFLAWYQQRYRKPHQHMPHLPKTPSSPDKGTTTTIEVPPIPWHTIGIDLFTLDGQQYLLIADYYTKYPIVEKLDSLTYKQDSD